MKSHFKKHKANYCTDKQYKNTITLTKIQKTQLEYIYKILDNISNVNVVVIYDELDKMNDFKATHEGFELNLDTDKYMELQDYLDAYYSRLASSNHFKQADTNEDNTQVRLRKCLNTQKYILENF